MAACNMSRNIVQQHQQQHQWRDNQCRSGSRKRSAYEERSSGEIKSGERRNKLSPAEEKAERRRGSGIMCNSSMKA